MWEMNHCKHWIPSNTTSVLSMGIFREVQQELVLGEMNYCEPLILSSTGHVLSVVDQSGDAQGISYAENESL